MQTRPPGPEAADLVEEMLDELEDYPGFDALLSDLDPQIRHALMERVQTRLDRPPRRVLNPVALAQMQADPTRIVAFEPGTIIHWERAPGAPPAMVEAMQRLARAIVAENGLAPHASGEVYAEWLQANEAVKVASAAWLEAEVHRLQGARPGEDGMRLAPEPCDLYREVPTVPGYCWCGHSRGGHRIEVTDG